jgi:hypothetical protein
MGGEEQPHGLADGEEHRRRIERRAADFAAGPDEITRRTFAASA